MLENKLGLYLVTFNRAPFLEKTLQALLDSPFAGCRLTILDNCSTDGTPGVCAAFAPRFRDCRVVRHARNITGNCNYLRAVELADTEYAWVVCDDDSFDFSVAAEVSAAVEGGKFDAVLFWSTASRAAAGEKRGGGRVPYSALRGRGLGARELAAGGVPLHTVMSFWPSCIFRTASFDSDCMHEGYEVAADCFPIFPFINRLLRANAPVYYACGDMVVATAGNYGLSYLRYLTGWMRACRTIKDPGERASAALEVFAGRGVMKAVGRAYMTASIGRYGHTGADMCVLFAALPLSGRIAMLCLLPVLLVPRFCWVFLENMRLRSRAG